MANDRESADAPPQPNQIPETTSSSYAKAVGEGWVVEGMMQMQKSIGEVAAHVNQLKENSAEHRRDVKADFRWTWSGLAAATVLLIGALIVGYFRLEDRQANLDTNMTKIATQLDDLLQRVPPAPLVPRPQPTPQVH